MKKRYTEEQIIRILKQAEAGIPVPDLLREHNIAQGTFYRWKAKFGGMEANEAKRLKALEEENRRLKRLVADAQGKMRLCGFTKSGFALLKQLCAVIDRSRVPGRPRRHALPGDSKKETAQCLCGATRSHTSSNPEAAVRL